MLYLASVLSLFVGVSFGAYDVDYPIQPTDISFHLGKSDPNYDECQLAGMDNRQPLEITPTLDNWDDVLVGCICGGMRTDEVFKVTYEHANGNSDLSQFDQTWIYTGPSPGGRIILTPKRKVGQFWSKIQSSNYADGEEIIVRLFRVETDEYGTIESLSDSFTMLFKAPDAEPGVEGLFVIRTEAPKGKRDCQSDSSDLSSAVAYGDDLYICIIFCNLLCTPDSYQTNFDIYADLTDSYGEEIIYYENDDIPPVLPSPELDCEYNVFETYRYIKVSNYGTDLSRIDVEAIVKTYGSEINFEDYRNL